MTSPKMEEICQKMADSFIDYEWSPSGNNRVGIELPQLALKVA